ncbi:ABC transporter substrate-binding protein [Streptomyces boninensis]|uniref:ABC transporter substrate-binding protein n=1 Tax=Streptomyces boninensis TaxID=2039455 RepID=UPI003B21D4FF
MRSISASSLSRRRLLGVGAAAAAGAALSACGGPAPGAAGAKGDGTGSLRMLSPLFDDAKGQKLLESMVAEFTDKHPGIDVQIDHTLYDKLNEKLTTAFAGGQPYDVMLMGAGWIPPFAKRKVLAELGDTRAGLAKIYNPRVVDPGVYEGKVYARPIVLDTRIGIYRKDIFADAGIDQPPKDLAEMREMGKELTVREGGKLKRAGIDILSNDPRQTFLPIMWAYGADLFKNGKPVFDSPEAIDALQWMTDIIRTDKTEEIGFTQKGALVSPITQDRAAMMIGHNDQWKMYKEKNPRLIKEDLIGAFLLKQERPAMFQGGTLATMSSRSKSQAAAKKLIDFLTGAEVCLKAAAARGNIPAANSAKDSAYVTDNKLVSFAMDHLDAAFSEGGIPAWLEIRDEFKPAVESALLGKASPQKALQQLADKAHTYINRSW